MNTSVPWGSHNLLWRNIQRSYLRLLLLAVLLVGSILFQWLYGTWLLSSVSTSVPSVEVSVTPYCDIIVLLHEDTDVVPFSKYPAVARPNAQSIYANRAYKEDEVAYAAVNSVAGNMDLLGLGLFFVFPDNALQGRVPSADDELLLPASYASRAALSIGEAITVVERWQVSGKTRGAEYEYSIVGIYDDTDWLFRPALATSRSVERYVDRIGSNAVLIQILPAERTYSSLEDVVRYMRKLYPMDLMLSGRTALELGAAVMRQRNASSMNVMFMFRLFLYISVQTVVLLDYQRRRKEFASLKSIGMSLGQIISMYAAEYAVAGGLALAASFALYLGLHNTLPWLQQLTSGEITAAAWHAVAYSWAFLFATLVFPLLVVCIASVSELLFAKTVPLYRTFTNHLDRATSDDVHYEQENNVRLLRIPVGSDAEGVMVFKSIGDMVKRGESIALQESWLGYVTREWQAWCDGTIVDIEVNGTIAIHPLHPNTPFYAYSSSAQKHRPDRHRNEDAREGAILMEESTAPVEPSTKRKMPAGKWRGWIALLAVVCIVGLLFLIPWTSPAQVDYITLPLLPTDMRNTVRASGRIDSLASAEVATLVAGKVEEIGFVDGELVEQGQLLLKLGNVSVDMALRQAQYELSVAQAEYDQALRLLGSEASEMQVAQQNVARVEAALTTLRQNQNLMDVRSAYAGYIREVYAQTGDSVRNRDVLFALYSHEHEDAEVYQVQVQQAQAQLAEAEQNLEKLHIYAAEEGVVTELLVSPEGVVHTGDALLNVRYTFEAKQGSALHMQQQLAEVEYRKAEQDMQNMHVIAPMSGYISELNMLPGEYLSTNVALATVSDDRQMLVRVQVPQSYINGIRVGNKAEIAIANSARTYSGTVSAVARVGEMGSNTQVVTYAVDIRIDNDGTLFSGMSATVSITSSDATFRSVSSLRGVLHNDADKIVYSLANGQLVEVLVENGSWVLQGQVIAVLENPALSWEYERARYARENAYSETFHASHHGVIESLHVQVGDVVHKGDKLLSLRSDTAEVEHAQAKLAYDRLASRATGNVDVYAFTAGIVETVFVHKGDTVVEGQLLARLAQHELELQEQQLVAELVMAQHTLESLQQNPEASQLDMLRLAREQAIAKVEMCEEKVRNLEVTALISGHIYVRTMPIMGEYLPESRLFADIYDSRLVLEVQVDEADVAQVKEGMRAEVHVDSLPEVTLASTVLSVSWRGMASGGMTVYPTALLLEKQKDLRLGMSCTVTIIVEEAENALVVPYSALNLSIPGQEPSQRREGEEILYKLVGDKPEKVVVTTGMRTENYVELRSGVQTGDVIIIGSRTISRMPGVFSFGGGTTNR